MASDHKHEYTDVNGAKQLSGPPIPSIKRGYHRHRGLNEGPDGFEHTHGIQSRSQPVENPETGKMEQPKSGPAVY